MQQSKQTASALLSKRGADGGEETPPLLLSTTTTTKPFGADRRLTLTKIKEASQKQTEKNGGNWTERLLYALSLAMLPT